MSERFADAAFAVFFGVIVLAIVALVGGVVLDSVQNYRAHDGEVACAAQRMESMRQVFSADVVCVPAIMRQDTTTVDLRQ